MCFRTLILDQRSSLVENFLSLKTEGAQKRWNCTFVDFSNYHRELRNEANQGISEVAVIDRTNAGDRVWVRCERQTFLRLPVSKAVVFGIRTYMWPLRKLIDEEGSEMGAQMANDGFDTRALV